MTRVAEGLPRDHLESTLDELQVTDRTFRELRFSLPLSRILARRVLEDRPARVLLIGLDRLLQEALERLGVDCDSSTLEADSGADRLQLVPPGGYDTVVVALPEAGQKTERILGRLVPQLAPQGRLLVALRGSRPDGRRELAGAAARLAAWGESEGLHAGRPLRVVPEEAWPSGKPLTLPAWVRAEVAHLVRRALPGFRDCLLVSLERGEAADAAGASAQETVAEAAGGTGSSGRRGTRPKATRKALTTK
jgi:hypothetical protein